MAQLNVRIDDELKKRVKKAIIEDSTTLEKWVATALELGLNFDEYAMARCKELGWTAPAMGAPVEIIDVEEERKQSKPGRIQKT